MIRFRFQEDERRFIKLHAEMFEKIARAGLGEAVGSETLRNVGKIEQMAYMEGIRQGLAMAAIATEMFQREMTAIPEPHAQKAFQLHALIYGSSDTPLRAVEKEWLAKIEIDDDHLAKSWLDDKPMRFAPATLHELNGTEPPIAPMVSVQAATKPMPVVPANPSTSPGMTDLMVTPDSLPLPETVHGTGVTPLEPWEKGEYEPDDDPELEAQIQRIIARKDASKADPPNAELLDAPESPDFLDLARDSIQTLKRGGWDPKTWQELILDLHRHMGVDAGYLDIQLTTHVGRAVLDQCGLMGMAPPDMVNMEFMGFPRKTT